jgi:DNA-binding transcriptional MerR regulator
MFRIGEFSKISQTPASQLRYYDEIGLLKPAKIDKWTGYRFYSAQQLPDLNRILALKELGMSLEQIRRMIDSDVSSEEIRGMLSLKKSQVEQTLMDEVNRLRHIEARLAQIENGDGLADYDIVVKSVPEQPFLSFRTDYNHFGQAFETMVEMHKALPGAIDRKQLGYFTALMHTDTYGTDPIDLEMGFVMPEMKELTVSMENGGQMTSSILPSVDAMVTAVRVGMPDESYACRGVLAGWMESNGYEISGVGREVFIVPPTPGREAETVMEIQYPIRLSDGAALPAI